MKICYPVFIVIIRER